MVMKVLIKYEWALSKFMRDYFLFPFLIFMKLNKQLIALKVMNATAFS